MCSSGVHVFLMRYFLFRIRHYIWYSFVRVANVLFRINSHCSKVRGFADITLHIKNVILCISLIFTTSKCISDKICRVYGDLYFI
jgi:hypothetical protein